MFQSVFSFLHVVIQSHKCLNGGGGQCPPTINMGGRAIALPPQWSLPWDKWIKMEVNLLLENLEIVLETEQCLQIVYAINLF